jgi:hypothetical protein
MASFTRRVRPQERYAEYRLARFACWVRPVEVSPLATGLSRDAIHDEERRVLLQFQENDGPVWVAMILLVFGIYSVYHEGGFF